jgi:hypothetical protein
LIGLAAGALLAGSASGADLDIQGDWNITGVEAYQGITIEVHETAPTNFTDGNLTVEPGGSLTLTNCTLTLPWSSIFYVGGTLVLDNTTVDGPAWFFWMNGTTTLTNTRIVNATYSLNSTYKEVWVESPATTFDRLTWTDANGNGSVVRMQVPLDFQGHTLTGGAAVRYFVNPSFANAAIDISQNRFYNSSLNAVYAVAVDGPAIPQPLHFEIHHNTFNGSGVGVGLLRVDVNTSYDIHHIDVNTTSFGTGIMPGVQGSGIRFKGQLEISDYTVLNAYVGVWMWGAAPYDMVVNITRMTAVNVSYVLSIGGGFAEVRDSSFLATRTWIYEGLSQGHIRVYNTADTAFFATLPGTNATVEHMVWLPLTTATWQGGVAMQGQVVRLANETGVVNLTVDPQVWNPQYVALWGVYAGGNRVDNRDLNPSVVSAGQSFACAPAQFYVGDGMAPFSIVCTDDRAPVISVSLPAAGAYINQSSFTMAGNLTEAGSGLAAFEFSLDNVSFNPITPGVNGSAPWTATVGPLSDGAYTVTLRASDRTGNLRYASVFPVRIDTVFPELAMGAFPAWTTATSWQINGSSEPFAKVTVRRAYGWNQTVTLGASGVFAITVPLDEGQNTYSVRVVDLAGNAVEGTAVIRVDTLAPSVVGLLDGLPLVGLWTANATVDVSGSCEAGAAVSVGAASVSRSGPAFQASVALVEGRNDIDVVCTDPAGNAGHWYAFAFRDGTPPVLDVTVDGAVELSPGRFLVTSTLVAIGGTVTDAGSGLDRASVSGNPVSVSGTGALTVSVETPEGETDIEVMAVDRAGNTAVVTLTIVRDSVVPEASFAWREAGSPIVLVGGVPTTAGAQAVLEITLSEPAQVAFGQTVLDLPAGVTRETVLLVPGQNRFSVNVTDAAGNAPFPYLLLIHQDREPPALTIYGPAEGSAVDTPSVAVSGHAEPGSDVTVGEQHVVLSNNGDFSVVVDLAFGQNTLVVEATDALGNAANRSVTVSYAPPEQPPETTPSGGLELPLLVAGLLGGLAVGALLSRARGGGRPPAGGPPAPVQEHPPAEEQAVEERPTRAPKGPRGPAPPPQ